MISATRGRHSIVVCIVVEVVVDVVPDDSFIIAHYRESSRETKTVCVSLHQALKRVYQSPVKRYCNSKILEKFRQGVMLKLFTGKAEISQVLEAMHLGKTISAKSSQHLLADKLENERSPPPSPGPL